MLTCLSGAASSLLILMAAAAEPGAAVPRKLIEFGWDEPDTGFLRRHIAQMQATPFDGCVFHVDHRGPDGKTGSFTWEGWGRRRFTRAEVRHAIDDLKATPFGRFRHNFLRFNTTPADLDWFDDFSAVLANARLAAEVAREGGCPGLLFDIEQYNAPLFDYGKQRDARGKSWEEYAQQARRRGREVMQAFQDGYPDLVVFLTFGYSLPFAQSDGGRKPLAGCGYGLLAPFMDGLVEAARGRTRIVDGCELAYGYREPADFARAAEMMRREVLSIAAHPDKYLRHLSVSFGIWLDKDWRKVPWDAQDPSRNVHTPAQFEALVRQALTTADEYVWIYSETPRWWTDAGGPAKLPKAYDEALRRAKATTAAPATTRPGR